MDRPPARGNGPADRRLQARAGARRRRGGGRWGRSDVDLREADDAAIAAELEAEAARKAEEEAEAAKKAEEEAAARAAAGEDEEPAEDAEEKPKRRARRGGRRRKSQQPFEGTFDHGDEGYGLWLDPGVEDDPIYAEHWAGHRPVEVTITEDEIVIKRAGD